MGTKKWTIYIYREKRIGIDEKTFYGILTQSFPSELELIDKIYFQRHNHKLLNAKKKN